MTLPEPYYDRDGIVIYHADCMDILPHLQKVDLVLTDPPYGIKAAGGTGGDNAAQARTYEDRWDDQPVPAHILLAAMNAGKWCAVFGGNYYQMPPSSCWLVWDKGWSGGTRTGKFADAELVWTNFGTAVRLIRHNWNGMWQEHMGQHKEHRFHPTQKPVPVMKWCIQRAPQPVASVLDPFMGSGTTLVAARDMGCKAIGIEIEERYCEIAVKRLAQGVLF